MCARACVREAKEEGEQEKGEKQLCGTAWIVTQ